MKTKRNSRIAHGYGHDCGRPGRLLLRRYRQQRHLGRQQHSGYQQAAPVKLPKSAGGALAALLLATSMQPLEDINAYTSEKIGVTVKWTINNWDTYQETFQRMVNGGDTFDISCSPASLITTVSYSRRLSWTSPIRCSL